MQSGASLRSVAAHAGLCGKHRFDRNLNNEKQREWHSLTPVADRVSDHLPTIIALFHGDGRQRAPSQISVCLPQTRADNAKYAFLLLYRLY